MSIFLYAAGLVFGLTGGYFIFSGQVFDPTIAGTVNLQMLQMQANTIVLGSGLLVAGTVMVGAGAVVEAIRRKP